MQLLATFSWSSLFDCCITNIIRHLTIQNKRGWLSWCQKNSSKAFKLLGAIDLNATLLLKQFHKTY